MSTVSPASQSGRKRQQAGIASQPQPIAPASTLVPNNVPTSSNPLATIKAVPAAVPLPINTEAANEAIEASNKSPQSPSSGRKRKAAEMASSARPDAAAMQLPPAADRTTGVVAASSTDLGEAAPSQSSPPAKKSRTNTPWTPAEERKLKTLRDAGSSWGEIAKEFPHRTEGSVKKHWYKDMHYADFAEDESAALLAAIRDYEANKWKEIGKKVGKPAKACEQYAKEHFSGKL